jgi:SEC-C motif
MLAGIPSLRQMETWSQSLREHSFRAAAAGAGKLVQAQFGTRVGEKTSDSRRIKRTNVLTFVEKLARRDPRLTEIYEWLCDAVHPSFGFGTVFVVNQGRHKTGATFAADLARITAGRTTTIVKPTVALAVTDGTSIVVDLLREVLPRLRWMAYDLAVAAGVPSPGNALWFGDMREPPGRNQRCPCGSGRKFKLCGHAWAENVGPPSR